MIGYILLFIAIFIVDRINAPLSKKYICAFWIISVFSGLRYGIGYDYFSYYQLMQNPENERELIPMFMLTLGREIHYSLFFLLSSLFINLFFLRGLFIAKCPFEAIYFYLGWPMLFVSTLSAVRQYMAIAVIFYLICLPNAKWRNKLFWIVIAFLCHKSSLISILLLFPVERIMNRKMMWLLFFFSLIIGELLVAYLLSITMNSLFIMKFLDFLAQEVEGGSFKRIMSYFIVVLILLNYNSLLERGIPNKYIAYCVIGGCLFALFSSQTQIAMRFCTFYQVSFMLIVIKLCKLRKFPLFMYKLLCVCLFIMSIYVGHNTSIETEQWAKYKPSSYYPYETVIGKNPQKSY